jgi:hypothetical protein
MSHHSIRITPQGPLFQVGVIVSAARRAALTAAGVAIPNLVLANLLIDTGASMTSIDSVVISKLGISATGTANILTPSTGTTPHVASTYDVGLFFVDGAGGGAANSKLIPAIPVLDGNYASQGIDGLIGRDILAQGRLIYSGVDQTVWLSF